MAFRILILDTETSGLPKGRNADPYNPDLWPHIVQIGAILYKCPFKGRPGRIMERYSALVKPNGWEISPSSQAIHGISMDFASKNGIPIQDVLEKLNELSSGVHAICCHNVAFDMPVIMSEYRRYTHIHHDVSVRIGSLPRICTMEIGKKICRMLVEGTRRNGDKYLYYKSPKLTELYQYLVGHEFNGKFHDALEDCQATVEIIEVLVTKYVPFLRTHAPDLFKPHHFQ